MDDQIKQVPRSSIVFGKLLRRLRNDRSLTQEELAFDSDLSRNYVGLLEKGERNPTLESYLRLAGALHISLTSLMSQFEADLQLYAAQNPSMKDSNEKGPF